MSAWSATRRLIIVTYIVLAGAIAAAMVYFLFIYNPPSCFDGVQNGYEEGIDCGGGCQLVCPFSASDPNVTWARAFETAPGVYNLAAEVENPNFNVGTTIAYTFRSYNSDNVLINEVRNTTNLYPTERKIIFEPAAQTGNRSIARTFFEFDADNEWYKVEATPKRVSVQSYDFTNIDSTPSLRVVLKNNDIRALSGLTVSAVVYNTQENIEQVSQTYVSGVPADGTAEAFFSWRRPFENEISNVEVFVVEPRD